MQHLGLKSSFLRCIDGCLSRTHVKLVEEARIARAKSAGDIRVLTRALEVKTLHQTPGQQKVAIAAGVGFLLSSILSLLVEYVRKAQARRTRASDL